MHLPLVLLLLALCCPLLACGQPGGKTGENKGRANNPVEPWKKKLTMDCPAYVRGSQTIVTNTPKGVTVKVTTSKADDVGRIREYARYVAGATRHSQTPETALQFGGATGNRTRNCPVVLKGTRVTAQEIPGGARLDVKAIDPRGVAALQKLSRTRLSTLKAMQKALEGLR